eukprot:CAMPEP_0116066356 /NCGR_PEP_ID=MMETSP0322-20121206/10327_1 /TAXON_ID=163516 /ORGANISM="Leptocylindrus danicus var. apora, Strain B651" /LENGTH=420 /DNA_ID=CAMNT_0003552881 /DNA_START=139 /DNA_END=1398 /DNA_ORIENTATION=+
MSLATPSSSSSSSSSSREMSRVAAFQTSKEIEETLDPCVVLMKDIIAKHAKKWEDKGDEIYSLAQGVVYWEPPKESIEFCAQALTTTDQRDTTVHTNPIDGTSSSSMDVHLYGPAAGLPQLVSSLEEKLRIENNLEDVEVMITAGANQAYMNCVLTLMDKNSKAVVFAPYYFNHVMAIQMHSGDESVLVGQSVSLKDEYNDIYVPDLMWLEDKLREEESSIRMVTLVNPGNPTGVSIPYSFMEKISNLCHRYGVWLVVDNTYEHFDHVGNNKIGDVPFACQDKEHVINIFSFSKSFSLAGFRIGYLTTSRKGPGKRMYEQMIKVQDTIPICVSRMSQLAALGALKAGRSWADKKVATLEFGRKRILDALKPLSNVMGGSGAMYVMGKLPENIDDVEFADELVEHYGVAVIPGTFCGYPGW